MGCFESKAAEPTGPKLSETVSTAAPNGTAPAVARPDKSIAMTVDVTFTPRGETDNRSLLPDDQPQAAHEKISSETRKSAASSSGAPQNAAVIAADKKVTVEGTDNGDAEETEAKERREEAQHEAAQQEAPPSAAIDDDGEGAPPPRTRKRGSSLKRDYEKNRRRKSGAIARSFRRKRFEDSLRAGVLSALPDEAVSSLVNDGELLSFEAGQVITEADDEATCCFIVVEGRVSVCKGGRGSVIPRLCGDFFGEQVFQVDVDLRDEDTTCGYSARAETQAKVLSVSPALFAKIDGKHQGALKETLTPRHRGRSSMSRSSLSSHKSSPR